MKDKWKQIWLIHCPHTYYSPAGSQTSLDDDWPRYGNTCKGNLLSSRYYCIVYDNIRFACSHLVCCSSVGSALGWFLSQSALKLQWEERDWVLTSLHQSGQCVNRWLHTRAGREIKQSPSRTSTHRHECSLHHAASRCAHWCVRVAVMMYGVVPLWVA